MMKKEFSDFNMRVVKKGEDLYQKKAFVFSEIIYGRLKEKGFSDKVICDEINLYMEKNND